MEMSIYERIFTSVLMLVMVAAVIALIHALDTAEPASRAGKPVAIERSRL
ncbi:hypothetical protein [Thermocoleostomius sinensis]|jgi:hypothetical protein|uniref:Uncharacterized protein n=1 Tax=Thermocoleostomius sinensis A174 TaxID=2016057 RepID=A0A9E8ZDW6_9CYAN|nr:hypothetical protein [Thermocoleostomius sinensis]WAL60042.1 hypothetical protein OXH18_23190 [Thermocoleostomius sinensis A174]